MCSKQQDRKLKKMKKIMIATIIMIVLALSGCTNSPQAPTTYYTGFSGLTFSFSNTMPPDTVYEGKQDQPNLIPIALELTNAGAYSITNNSKINLTIWHGRSPYLSSVGNFNDPNTLYTTTIQLSGRSQDWPYGENQYLPLGRILEVNSLTSLLQNNKKQDVNIFATACYPYETKFTQSICIDADVYHTDNNPICRNQPEYDISDGQGAPIAITKIESEMIPFAGKSKGTPLTIIDFSGNQPVKKTATTDALQGVQPSFNIYVANKGHGNADVSKKAEDICSSTSGFVGVDKVNVSANIAGVPLQCNPQILELNQNAFTTCYLGKGYLINRNYVNLLNVNLKYYYKETIQKKMTIKSLPDGRN